MEIGEYPSVIGVKVEVRAGWDAGDEFAEKASLAIGLVKKEIRDLNGSRYFVIELESPIEGVRFLTVSERHAGASIPREFSRRPENPVIVGVGAVLDESLLDQDAFDFKQVKYFSIGEIRRLAEKRP